MSVDYQELVSKKQELDQKIAEREAELRELAQQLLDDYQSSLNYQGDSLTPLAFIGDVNEDQVVVLEASQLQLATNYHVKFKVFTDLNVDGVTQDYIIVGVDLHKSKHTLKVMIGGGQPHSSLSVTQHEGRYSFDEVCSKIKQRVMKLIDGALPL